MTTALTWVDRRTGKTLARCPLPRRRLPRALVSKGRNLVVALSNWPHGSEVLGFRDAHLLFSKRHDSIATLSWLPSGLLVDTRYDGIGILSPATGERLQDVAFHEYCDAAQPAEAEGRLYALTAPGALFALRWPPST